MVVDSKSLLRGRESTLTSAGPLYERTVCVLSCWSTPSVSTDASVTASSAIARRPTVSRSGLFHEYAAVGGLVRSV